MIENMESSKGNQHWPLQSCHNWHTKSRHPTGDLSLDFSPKNQRDWMKTLGTSTWLHECSASIEPQEPGSKSTPYLLTGQENLQDCKPIHLQSGCSFWPSKTTAVSKLQPHADGKTYQTNPRTTTKAPETIFARLQEKNPRNHPKRPEKAFF